LNYPVCARCGQPESPRHPHKKKEWNCPQCNSIYPPKSYACPECNAKFDTNYNLIKNKEWDRPSGDMSMGDEFSKGDDTTRRKK